MIQKLIVILLVSGLFVSCGSKFKEPLCTEELSSLPPQFYGVYMGNFPNFKNGQLGNVIESFNQTLIKISADGISVPLSSLNSLSPGSFRSSKICTYQEKIFLQQLGSDGTYSLSRMQVTQYGISFSDLVLTSKIAADLNLKSVKVPGVSQSIFSPSEPKRSGWNSSGNFEDSIFYLNVGIPSANILDKAQYMYIQGHLQRVTEPKNQIDWRMKSWKSLLD